MTIASRGGICQREVCLSEDGTVFPMDPSPPIPTGLTRWYSGNTSTLGADAFCSTLFSNLKATYETATDGCYL